MGDTILSLDESKFFARKRKTYYLALAVQDDSNVTCLLIVNRFDNKTAAYIGPEYGRFELVSGIIGLTKKECL